MHLLHFAMRRALPVLGAALVCASAFAQDAYPAKPVMVIASSGLLVGVESSRSPA